MREVVVKLLMFIFGAFMAIGCAASPHEAVPPERAQCYADVVRQFWISVEECKKAGRDYSDCDVDNLAKAASEQMEGCP